MGTVVHLAYSAPEEPEFGDGDGEEPVLACPDCGATEFRIYTTRPREAECRFCDCRIDVEEDPT